MKAPRTWYVVMNTSRARVLRDLPGPREPAPIEISLQGPRRRLREVMEDRATRSYSSAGGGRRAAVEPGSDPIAEDARNFVREVVEYLDKQRLAKAFDRLVVIASSDAIGIWRAELPEALAACVQHEFVKNLVRFSARELVAAIRGLTSA
ncbi:host attachment protein [Histidinibacterium aquaticum]|uniref:Host attachment protein n=1 Tax=Histidinibacterium aquaticum TaxID=2613962 RepID=A0A5J5GGQ4_9RHOB|nr:host attachment protein [Histidinibacterium aquaticum]KAA9006704.1 host attachment protein [Histidinibacterium aquaticum]